jgi:sugar lactone lactonase YvrE
VTVEYYEAEPWLQVADSLGESPRFDARTGSVHWIDIDAGLRRAAALDGSTASAEDFGAPLGAHEFGVRRDAVAVGGDWFSVDRITGDRRQVASIDEPGMRFNDSAVDSRGRLWSATMRKGDVLDGEPRGTLRLLADDALQTRLGGLTAGNGIAWSPDDRFMYLVDSGPDRVLRMEFDVDSGAIGAPDVWLEPRDGAADGITSDLAGGVWVALWGSGALHRYDATGRHVAVVRVTARQVTAACFAGRDLRTLIITTAGRDTAPGESGGTVFRADVPIPGRPATPWRGR